MKKILYSLENKNLKYTTYKKSCNINHLDRLGKYFSISNNDSKNNNFFIFNYKKNFTNLQNFNKIQKYNFADDGSSQKLKKKFYKKVDLGILKLSTKEEFLKINEFTNPNNSLSFPIDENIFKNLNLENLDRENLKQILFSSKLSNFDDDTKKSFEKKFEKLKNLFSASLFHKKYYSILLDNRRCKSMYLDELKIPNKKLALALAIEWQSQEDMINLYTMHLVIFIYSKVYILESLYV